MTAEADHLASDALLARLQVAARQRFGAVCVEALRELPGGHSGLTWIADLDGGPIRSVVVKQTPPGRKPVGRHDVLRQARILRALGALAAVPVPRVHLEDVHDPPFFAMELVSGTATEPVLEPPDEDESAERTATAWDAAVRILARLHGADVSAAVEHLGEPPSSPEDEVARWAATMRAAGREADDKASALLRALSRRVPSSRTAALAHGDFRLGNMLREQGVVRAVVDWEIWSIGDPRMDLGWLLLYTEPDNFPGLARAVAGAPAADDVLATYEALTGTEPEKMAWFRALACFKLAAAQAHNLRRHRDGRRPDPYLERFAPSVDRLLQIGLEHLACE